MWQGGGEVGSTEFTGVLDKCFGFFYYFFFIGRRQSSLRALVLTHINVVAASPIHNIIRIYN